MALVADHSNIPERALLSSAIRKSNLQTLRLFFDRFHRDREGFLELWSDDPVVEIPFAPPGLPKHYRSRQEFLAFWDPIFQSFRGKFDWTITELIAAEDPDVIIALTKSDVDVTSPHGALKYQGEYVQVFRFHSSKIQRFSEYVDTAFMSKVYGFA